MKIKRRKGESERNTQSLHRHKLKKENKTLKIISISTSSTVSSTSVIKLREQTNFLSNSNEHAYLSNGIIKVKT